MENRTTRTVTRQPITYTAQSNARSGSDELTEKRLNALLKLNAETAKEKALFATEQEKFEASTIKNPLNSEKTFAYFGLLLGTFPPAAIFLKFIMEGGGFNGDDFWIVGVMAIINLISAGVGYFSGKLIGKIVRELEQTSWLVMLLTIPFIGALWGIMSGGAGGVIVFVIGAFFGAYLGAMVGAVALPIFGIFHRLIKKGDLIERNQFLPLAFGVTFVICAFILGL